MKKLILFLLPLFALAQNPTNFPYGIKNTAGVTNSTPTYFVTQETDGVHKKTPAATIALKTDLDLKQTVFTGICQKQFLTENDFTIDNSALTLTISTVKNGTAISSLNPVRFFTDGSGIAVMHEKISPVTFNFTNTTGIWYFYFDSSGNPIATQTPWTEFSTIATVYRFYWNATLGVADRRVIEAVEFHKNDVSWVDHAWKHLDGAKWSSGLTISSNAISAGTPAVDGSNAVITLSSGTILDDNIYYTLTNASTGSVKFTQNLGTGLLPATSGKFICISNDSGGLLQKIPATDFPFLWNSGTNTPEYLTVNGTRTAVTANNYFVYYVYALQDPRYGETIKIKSAETDFANLTLAQAHNWEQLQTLFPTLRDGEIRLLYKLTFEYKTSYGVGTKKSVLRFVDDLRKQKTTTTAVASGTVPATNVSVSPIGGISSTNAQSAFQELDSETVKLTGNQTIEGAKTFVKSLKLETIEAPTAPLITVSAVSGGLIGNYMWAVSYYTADGKETNVDGVTSVISVSSKQVDISNISISSNPLVVGRRLYRCKGDAIDPRLLQLVADIPNNTGTTYTDNVPDISLGVFAPWFNNTGGELLLNGNRFFSIDGASFAIGKESLPNNTGYANQSVGNFSGHSLTTGYRNTFTGLYSGYSLTTGFGNTANGVHSLNYNINGSHNTTYGISSLINNTSGSENTAIGAYALEANISGSSNVAIGYTAGSKETGSNKFIVANTPYNDATDGKERSLFYGDFSAYVPNQKLRINANVGIGVDSSPSNSLSATGNVSALSFSTSGSGTSLKDGEIYSAFGVNHTYYNGSTIASAFNYNNSGIVSFVNIPTAPTATVGTNTTQIATTAFVQESKILPVTETGTSFSLTDAYNGKVIIFTGSCTVTIPNGLVANFECSFVTLTGVTLTVATGGSVVLHNNTGTTMAEKLSCTIKQRTTLNNYIVVGSL